MAEEQKTKWLILPLEIVERELQGKLLLAIEAAKHGWQSIIGTKKALLENANELPRGVVLLKSVIPSEADNMRRFRNAGHFLSSLDEEGLVQTSLERMARMRFSDETVNLTDLFLCWGDIQHRTISAAFPEQAQKFKISGSPRVDLWNPRMHDFYKDEVQSIKKRFGDFIFIPSSFGWPNHYMGQEAAMNMLLNDKMIKDQADYEYFRQYQAYAGKIFTRFLEFLPQLAKSFPKKNIVIRPHPSERPETWHEAAKGLENVKVVFEGSVTPWLLAADAIFHWGSTTGIEAHLMGKPVIAYSPVSIEEAKKYDLKIPHSVSIQTRIPEEAITTLQDVISNPINIKDRYLSVAAGHEALKEWMHGMEDASASASIMNYLSELSLEKSAMKNNQIRSCFSPKELIWKILEHFSFLKYLYPKHIQKGLSSRAYGRHKTKDIDEDVLHHDFKKLSNFKNIKNIHAVVIAKNLYKIGPI